MVGVNTMLCPYCGNILWVPLDINPNDHQCEECGKYWRANVKKKEDMSRPINFTKTELAIIENNYGIVTQSQFNLINDHYTTMNVKALDDNLVNCINSEHDLTELVSKLGKLKDYFDNHLKYTLKCKSILIKELAKRQKENE